MKRARIGLIIVVLAAAAAACSIITPRRLRPNWKRGYALPWVYRLRAGGLGMAMTATGETERFSSSGRKSGIIARNASKPTLTLEK